MSAIAFTVEATLQSDGVTLQLEKKVALPPGRVTVTVQTTGALPGPAVLPDVGEGVGGPGEQPRPPQPAAATTPVAGAQTQGAAGQPVAVPTPLRRRSRRNQKLLGGAAIVVVLAGAAFLFLGSGGSQLTGPIAQAATVSSPAGASRTVAPPSSTSARRCAHNEKRARGSWRSVTST